MPRRMPRSGTLAPLRVILLAAGYGTRLGTLGEDRPKALLPLGGRPLLDHLMDRLAELEDVESALLVSNHRFADHFRGWRRRRSLPWPIRILDDGTARPEERLGAIRDLRLALKRVGVDDPTLVTATDSVFAFSLRGLLEEARRRPEARGVVAVVAEDDPERLRRSGVAEIDDDGRIARLHEKPEDPPAGALVLPLYLFRPRALAAVDPYLAGGREPDAPGHFLAWLVERARVGAWRAPGRRWDVGTPEAYRRARGRFSEERDSKEDGPQEL